MNESNLTLQQEQALVLALSGKKDTEIGAAIGVSRKTVNRWRHHDQDFRLALADRREVLREGTADALQALSTQAIGVLSAAMQSENEHVRLKAAALVLKSGVRRRRTADQVRVDREVIERQIVITALEESLTEIGRAG